MDLKGVLVDNKYEIIDVLGQGGMSVVYLAKDIKLQKYWAVKQVSKDILNRTVSLMVETNILKKLDHGALPRVVDIIDDDENIYVVLDFIDGISLDKRLKEIGIDNEATLIDWAKQICDVLNYLHNQKPNPIIYRDMKPGNIMLTSQNKLKLIDFGIAREYKEDASSDTTHIGTRGYAAPEQYGSHQTDARTDIYSLGVTLYHLATGKSPNEPPFEIKPVRELNPSLSEGFEYIILKCTQTDPQYRYQTINELLFDLQNIHKLNSVYRKMIRSKIIKLISVVCSFVFFAGVTAVGVNGVKKENTREYQIFIDDAQLYKSKGKMEEAINELKKAIEVDASESEAYIKIADIYSNEMLDNESSVKFLQKVVDSNSSAANNSEVLYRLGMAYFQEGYYSKADQNFSKIKENKIADLKYYKTVCKALGGSSKDKNEVDNAVKELEGYVESSIDQKFKTNGYIILSSIYMENSDLFSNSDDKVIEVLEKAKSQSKDINDYRLYERLGQAYYNKAVMVNNDNDKLKEYMGKSLEYYNQVAALGYKSSTVYRKRGLACKYLHNYEESEKIFKEMIDNYPNDYKGFIELGLLYIEWENAKPVEQRNYDKVKQNYLTASKLPNSENNAEFDRLKKIMKDLNIVE